MFDIKNNLERIKTKLSFIELGKLKLYTLKIGELASISRANAPIYIRDFILAYTECSTMYALAVQLEIDIKSHLEAVESIAYLEKAPIYLISKVIKDTSEARKQYTCIDDDVKEASDLKGMIAGLSELLKNKLAEYRMAHDGAKKMAYDDGNQTNVPGY